MYGAGGRQKALPAALYCALGAGGIHFLNQTLHWDQALRRTLVRMDLLDDEGGKVSLVLTLTPLFQPGVQ